MKNTKSNNKCILLAKHLPGQHAQKHHGTVSTTPKPVLDQAVPAPIESNIIKPYFLQELYKTYQLDWKSPFHGAPHWEGVRQTGLYLAKESGADPEVVELFAYMHDTFRQTESETGERHGIAAAAYVDKYNHKFFEITDKQADLLKRALSAHSRCGLIRDDVTVRTCIDADRLSLARIIGVNGLRDDLLHLPISKRLSTKKLAFRNAGKYPARFENES